MNTFEIKRYAVIEFLGDHTYGCNADVFDSMADADLFARETATANPGRVYHVCESIGEYEAEPARVEKRLPKPE